MSVIIALEEKETFATLHDFRYKNGQVADTIECGDKLSAAIKHEEFLDRL